MVESDISRKKLSMELFLQKQCIQKIIIIGDYNCPSKDFLKSFQNTMCMVYMYGYKTVLKSSKTLPLVI